MTVRIGDARRGMPVSIQAVHGNRTEYILFRIKINDILDRICSFGTTKIFILRFVVALCAVRAGEQHCGLGHKVKSVH